MCVFVCWQFPCSWHSVSTLMNSCIWQIRWMNHHQSSRCCNKRVSVAPRVCGRVYNALLAQCCFGQNRISWSAVTGCTMPVHNSIDSKFELEVYQQLSSHVNITSFGSTTTAQQPIDSRFQSANEYKKKSPTHLAHDSAQMDGRLHLWLHIASDRACARMFDR